MSRRLPSNPPVLPGFTFVRALGSGGFADVFLYEQNLPRRQVAVKVLLPEVVNPRVRNMFQAEAQLMAQLSTHPAILTVFEASVSADGRPYLVTEMCPAGLGEKFRAERMPVSEVLRTGIRIAGALETAHRSHVLHRDIKPGNILLTAYGHPVLSDFGIAASIAQGNSGSAMGLSVPWSAPEVLREETTGTIASEVFSLGATVYSLGAGRSPFEIVGKDNTPGYLAGRILRGKIVPMGRDDVPSSLQILLAKSMSRHPEDRPHSAMEFARQLQVIESELGLAQTAIDVVGDGWGGTPLSTSDEQTSLTATLAVEAPWWRRKNARRDRMRSS